MAEIDTPRSATGISIRLSIMMFIQFFIWGAWYVTGPLYLDPLGFTGTDFGWMYSVGPIAGMISPFFVGMIADRFFSTERVLGVMHLGGAGAMFGAISLMRHETPDPNMINLMFFVHMLFYFPTLALTNTLALKNMTNAEKQFPLIRVFGTIGWIIAGLTISFIGWDADINMFNLAAGAALVMGIYSFTLPHTPPVPSEKAPTARELLGLEALVLLKRPSFAVFMASSFLICIPLAFYYQMASRVVQQADLVPALTMSFGQMSEIFFMLVMPFFFVRLGVKWMLFVGMLAWVARYALFAIGAPDQVVWMILLGVLLHGICYDFFFVTGQIYTDKAAPRHIKGQAQGMLVLFTLGLGMFIGAQVGGRVEAKYTPIQTGRIQQEAAVIGEGAGARLSALARLMIDDLTVDQEQFASYVAASTAVLGDDDARTEQREAFLAEVATMTKPIQDQINAAYRQADDTASQVKAKLREELAALTERHATTVGEPAKTRDQIIHELETEAEARTEAALQQADDEAARLVEQKIVLLDEIATKIAQSRIGSYNEANEQDVSPAIASALILEFQAQSLAKYSERRNIDALRMMDWQSIWTIPAIGAAVVMILFAIFFRDPGDRAAEPVDDEDVAEAGAAPKPAA